MIFGVLLLTLCLQGCSDGPPSLDNDAEARAQLNSLQAEQAKNELLSVAGFETLQGLLRRFPEADPVRELAIREYLARRDFFSLSEALGSIPAAERSHEQNLLFAHALTSQKKHHGALAVVIPLLEAAPDDPTLLWMAGYNAFHCSEHEQAARHFDRGWEGILAHGYTEALALRALLYLYRGELERAEELVARAIEAAPNSLVARNAQGRILQALGRIAEADVAFAQLEKLQQAKEAVQRRQHLAISKMREIEEAWRQQRYADVEALVVETVPIVSPTQQLQLFRLMVSVFEAMGRHDEAREMHRRLEALKLRGGGQ